MQKWYPESFSNEGSLTKAEAPDNSFEAMGSSVEASSETLSLEVQFRSETGFLDSAQLMSTLTIDERTQVFNLVEQDVRLEYAQKEEEMALANENKIQEMQKKYEESINIWSSEFNRITEQELKKSSAAAAHLAILLAEKIVRCQVKVDEDVLVRTLETSLFKIQSAAGITVTVNPDDAASLNENHDLLEKLNIASVDTDRRIQPGGCLVKNSDMEWDATVESQLDSLAEVVEEMITTSDSVKLPEVNHASEDGSHEMD